MKTFHWGVSASAAQTEGAATTDGKGLSIWDTFTSATGRSRKGISTEPGTGFYYRYKEDLEILAGLGIPNFRFSFSWPRIMPTGRGTINQKGLDFYDRLIDECLEKGITPWVTLYHWDLPQALESKGGWTNREILNHFESYVSLCGKKYGDRVKNWMVLNEPLAFCGAGYFLGIHAPGRRGRMPFMAAAHHAALATSIGADVLRNTVHQAYIGSTYSFSWITPQTEKESDREAALRANDLLNNFFLYPALGKSYPLSRLKFLQQIEKFILPGDEQKLKADLDFIGVQNYTREVIRYSWLSPFIKATMVSASKRGVPVTAMNWEIYPEGIYHVLKNLSDLTNGLPLIVTENGAAFDDIVTTDGNIHDDLRIRYLNEYIQQVIRAKREGVHVGGYFVWSLTDNFEWAEGYRPRFGLVHIDYRNSLKRTVKESGRWYAERIRFETGA